MYHFCKACCEFGGGGATIEQRIAIIYACNCRPAENNFAPTRTLLAPRERRKYVLCKLNLKAPLFYQRRKMIYDPALIAQII